MLSPAPISISAVTPTRNRPQHLRALLKSLSTQTHPLIEIIVVDSSDDVQYHRDILREFAQLPLKFIQSTPSVCIQRNIGILAAKGEWILLVDDDIELDVNYLEDTVSYIKKNPAVGAVAGRLLQLENDKWVDQYPPSHFTGLLFKYIFQLPIWGDLGKFERNALARPILKSIQKRRNTFTRAGWPLISHWTHTFQTSVYSLGANVIRRQWLLNSSYDEVLGRNGIGDNFGVAIGFPGDQSIHVINSVRAKHYRATENREEAVSAYFKRVLSLHYFLNRSRRFSRATNKWFYWSLLGNTFYFFMKGKRNYAYASVKALSLMIAGKNPYTLGAKQNQKTVEFNF
jgi:glycosyltransferase involved in cell wall biosynthesis